MGAHSHKKPDNTPQTQRAKQAADRKAAQQQRGSKQFQNDQKQPHLGASRSQSGQPKR